MNIEIFVLDSFTTKRFKGNPAGVCYLTEDIDETLMLSISRELNLPVTAFTRKSTNESYYIRYFTPLMEISACGHATLATAAVIESRDYLDNIQFKTINGTKIRATVKDGFVSMHYPLLSLKSFDISSTLLKGLGVSKFDNLGYCVELETLFIELSAKELRNLDPDFKTLLTTNDNVKEVVITSASDNHQYDYLIRSFCPWMGIDEDPVTGSVHSALAPYWSGRLNKKDLKAFQASSRGGEIKLKVGHDLVEISGGYVFVLDGKLRL